MKQITMFLLLSVITFTHLFASTSERDLGKRPKLDLAKVNQYIIELTNIERKKHDLAPFKIDTILSKAAQIHNRFLIRYKRLTHYGKPYRLPRDRVKAACKGDTACLDKYNEKGVGVLYGCCGENIIESFALTTNGVPFSIHRDDQGEYRIWTKTVYWFNEKTLAKDMVQRWMNSPPHRRNILLKNYKVLGVAVTWDNDERYFGTQVFAPLNK